MGWPMSGYISAKALLESAQRMAEQIEELRNLQRQVREAEARVLGERSPRDEEMEGGGGGKMRPRDTAGHVTSSLF